MNENTTNTKILVIDDHPFFGNNLKYKLKIHGFDVFMAGNGMEGIILAKQLKPDIILIDYIMPQMDGIETCQRLKKDNDLKDASLIMYTSEAYSEVIAKAIKAGAVDFMTKTLPLEKILEKLNKIMEQKNGS
jgi:two-component system alkaline phosphatase synthesis response regulator PhoP